MIELSKGVSFKYEDASKVVPGEQSQSSVMSQMTVDPALSKKEQVQSQEEIEKAVKQAEKVASAFDRSLKFEYKKEAGFYQVMVMEVDKDIVEGERVIRKIPPDEVVNFVEHIKDMFGALMDLKA